MSGAGLLEGGRRLQVFVARSAVVFLLLGIGKSVVAAVTNRYLAHGLDRLALLELAANLNTYAVLLLVGVVGFGGVWAIVAGAVRALPRRWPRLWPGSTLGRRALEEAVLVCAGWGVLLVPLVFEYRSIERLLKSTAFVQQHLRTVPFLKATFDSPTVRLALFLGGCAVLLAALFRWLYRRRVRILSEQGVRRPPTSAYKSWMLSAALLLVVLLTVNAAVVAGRGGAGSERRNVLLISIDTLRGDHLGAYGHWRDTSPNIDRLAASATRFNNAVAQASWTLPSMASLLTALYPWQHGAVHWDRRLPRHVVTLAEALKNNSYTTIAVVTNEFVGRSYGFDQGYDVFDDTYLMGHSGSSSSEVTTRAVAYLREHGNSPFFMWVHYFDPHYDYEARDGVDFTSGYGGKLPPDLEIEALREVADQLTEEDREFVLSVYDEEIRATDEQIGRLLAVLEAEGLRERTLVVVTSDHGEEFFERGRIGHAKYVTPELVKVPLIMYFPGIRALEGTEVEEPIELRSIPRTILDFLGISGVELPGEDLLGVASGRRQSGYVLTEGTEAWHKSERRVAIISGSWKLIRNLTSGEEELYDLASDPGERVDLAQSESSEVQRVAAKLRSDLQSLAGEVEEQPDRLPPDSELEGRLRALGYLQ